MTDKFLDTQQLREHAITQLIQPPVDAVAPLFVTRLLHELHVHQVELEMQNNELQRLNIELEQSRDRYAGLYDFAPIGYVTLSTAGMIIESNLTAARLLGVERHKLIHQRFAHYINPEERDRWYLYLLHAKQSGEPQTCELSLCRLDQSTFSAQLNSVLIETDDAPAVLCVAVIDISERVQAETDARIAAIAFESQESMMITDAYSVILKVNRAFTETTGYSADEVIGKTPQMLQSGQHDVAFYQAMRQSITQTGSWKGEVIDKRKNGEIYPKWLVINAVKNRLGKVTHYVGIHSDITDKKAAENKIEHLAFYDVLTDLPNRRLLMNRLPQALILSARTDQYGALLFIDLDNFKNLNDNHGHDKGDLLLQQVAQRLVASVRTIDTVARWGGDEFVVILENLSTDSFEAASQTKQVGEKILATLNQPYALGEQDYNAMSASMGISLFNGYGHSEHELLKRIDIAMYQAKAAGRNTLRFFDPQMQAAVIARAALENELHQAVLEQQFLAYYQMQVNQEGNIIGAEVLIRWQHPTRGVVMPWDFIPLAEETGLILSIGQWVLQTACTQLQTWQANPATAHLQLAVNVSAQQFHQADFVEQVVELLSKTAIDTSKLKLELTETLVLDDINDTVVKMNALRDIGVRFSMDDFGTGYSSLSYLSELPFHQLKIDQSFVRNMHLKPANAVIVQTIIGMAKILGMEVIAEGVETQAQRDFLHQHGCFLCQGYLFSQPVNVEAFEQLLRREV